MKKICVITGNRADYSRLKSVMKAIKKKNGLKLTLFAIASHLLPDMGETVNVLVKDGFKVDAFARTVIEGEDPTSMAKSVGLGSLELATLLGIYKPDIVLVAGDRFEILSAVVTAAIMNIPVAHIQGGEVTGSIDESIRHAVTKFAHIHFPSTKKSAERILKMGEKKENVYMVGCPSVDIIRSLDYSRDLYGKYHLKKGEKFLLACQHPVTTEFGLSRFQIAQTLEALKELKMKTIFMFPNIDAGSEHMIREIRSFEKANPDESRIFKYKHIVFEDFLWLIKRASCMVGNSSAGIREAGYFGTPVVNIGSRQNLRERGANVTDAGYDKKEIVKAARKMIGRVFKPVKIYGAGNSGEKIAEILSKIDTGRMGIQKKIQY